MLERRQVWFDLAAIGMGLLARTTAPGAAPVPDALLWPVLALMLYVTFVKCRCGKRLAQIRRQLAAPESPLNCTQKRPKSHTDLLLSVPAEFMRRAGVEDEVIRPAGMPIALGVQQDMTEHGWSDASNDRNGCAESGQVRLRHRCARAR